MIHKYKAKAKINLFLHVINKLDSGYHNLESLVVFADVYDELFYNVINSKDNILSITGDFAKNIPNDNNNLILKAVNYMQKEYNLNSKLQITLHKNLPSGAGIGGGSSDCAITILAINNIYNLNLNKSTLQQIALKFGADVPVCLEQKSSVFYGIGEHINPYNNIPKNLQILLINPKIHISTKDIFNKIEGNYSSSILKYIDNFDYVINNTQNDLSKYAISIEPQLTDILHFLNHTPSIISRMSGSGSTCFAIYNSDINLDSIVKEATNKWPNFWIKKSIIS